MPQLCCTNILSGSPEVVEEADSIWRGFPCEDFSTVNEYVLRVAARDCIRDASHTSGTVYRRGPARDKALGISSKCQENVGLSYI